MKRKGLLKRARIARRHGQKYPFLTAYEANKAGLTPALGYALAEQETGTSRNVYGHDPVRNPAPKGGHVTKRNYLGTYLPARRRGLGMQGVGPLQLTWYATQDVADRLGGCYRRRYNLRVGFRTLAALIRQYGYADGIRRYNGSGPAADAYSRSVRSRAAKWYHRFN